MAYETILVETKGRVGVVRLNRPNALNALNAQLIDEVSKAFDAFEDDEGICTAGNFVWRPPGSRHVARTKD